MLLSKILKSFVNLLATGLSGRGLVFTALAKSFCVWRKSGTSSALACWSPRMRSELTKPLVCLLFLKIKITIDLLSIPQLSTHGCIMQTPSPKQLRLVIWLVWYGWDLMKIFVLVRMTFASFTTPSRCLVVGLRGMQLGFRLLAVSSPTFSVTTHSYIRSQFISVWLLGNGRRIGSWNCTTKSLQLTSTVGWMHGPQRSFSLSSRNPQRAFLWTFDHWWSYWVATGKKGFSFGSTANPGQSSFQAVWTSVCSSGTYPSPRKKTKASFSGHRFGGRSWWSCW